MSEQFHNYAPVVAGVVLAALLSAVLALFTRLSNIEDAILHVDYLEEKFDNINHRIGKLEQKVNAK